MHVAEAGTPFLHNRRPGCMAMFADTDGGSTFQDSQRREHCYRYSRLTLHTLPGPVELPYFLQNPSCATLPSLRPPGPQSKSRRCGKRSLRTYSRPYPVLPGLLPFIAQCLELLLKLLSFSRPFGGALPLELAQCVRDFIDDEVKVVH